MRRCLFAAKEKRFTPRQKLCYTAIAKFALTNSSRQFPNQNPKQKSRHRLKKRIFYQADVPIDTAGVQEDKLSLHFAKVKHFVEAHPLYDPDSPYTKFKWYVHAEDPGYKPRFPKKPWVPCDRTDLAPRKTYLGYEPDPLVERMRIRREGAKQLKKHRATQKLKEAEAAEEAANSRRLSDAVDTDNRAMPSLVRHSSQQQSLSQRHGLASTDQPPSKLTPVNTPPKSVSSHLPSEASPVKPFSPETPVKPSSPATPAPSPPQATAAPRPSQAKPAQSPSQTAPAAQYYLRPEPAHRPSTAREEPSVQYQEPEEVASQPPHKSVKYYQKESMEYYKRNRDMHSPTVRQLLVSSRCDT